MLSDEHEFEFTIAKITNRGHWTVGLIDLGVGTIFLLQISGTIVVVPSVSSMHLNLISIQVLQDLEVAITEVTNGGHWAVYFIDFGVCAIFLLQIGGTTVVAP